jgi:hypothetical protein
MQVPDWLKDEWKNPIPTSTPKKPGKWK